MATHIEPSPVRLDPPIESLLAQLRRRIRAYLWADGVAGLAIYLATAFWASLAFDWVFEPPAALRVVVLALMGLGLGLVVYRGLLSRILVRMNNRRLALVIERRYRQFHDSLVTVVELAEEPEHAAAFHPEMLSNTRRDAVRHAAEVELRALFNAAPLARRTTLAVALAVGTLVFAAAAPSALGVWGRRTFLLSAERWPRKTRLSVEGFDNARRIKIARGSDFALVAKAEAAIGRVVPEIVEVRYSTREGVRGRENMSREGLVQPGEAAFQPYTYTFKSVLAPLEFYVAGGDDRQGPFLLDVVDSPTISRMTLDCQYPPYMRREPREIPVAGVMQIPQGTQIRIRAEANKPLISAQIDEVVGDQTPLTHRLDLVADQGQPQTRFEFSLPRLDADKTLLFTLRDGDGIRSREAVRLSLTAVADEAPQVNVQLKGIGAAITPNARLPAVGEVSDDYGLARLWFDFHVDEQPAQSQPLAAAVDNEQKLPVADILEVRDLKLEPKQKLHWAVQAADGCVLESGPNFGSSQKYVLDVVTPEVLRAMLEARELALRRRFETILEELTDTRNLLATVEVQPSSQAAPPPVAADKAPAENESGNEQPADAVRPTAISPAVQVERVLQNSQRAAHESLQVAMSFDEIREEMINNRIDTEELKTRLKQGVADPLRQIVAGRFPPLEERLKQLSAHLTQTDLAQADQATALREMDGILVEMRAILDKMLELETFNEVLDMLRQIIDSQEKINEETKQKQKEKLKDLIE
jgi:hypothetical protein